jgi:hypothetical protein
MRVTVLILALVLGAIMAAQSLLGYGVSGIAGNAALGGATAVGLLVALLWLVAAALVIPLPLVSCLLFVAGGLLGFAVSADFPDMAVWGGASLTLAALSFFGWRGKRRADLRDRLDREERQALARQVAALGAPRDPSIPPS